MKLEWNLKELFENNNDFYQEIENTKQKLSEIKKYKTIKLNENNLLKMLDEKWKIKQITNNILVYGSLKYYKNVKSKECQELKSTAEKFSTKVNLELNFVDEKIIKLGQEKVQKYMNKNDKLKIYSLSLNNLFRMQKHIQNESINKKIKENIDSINGQLNKYNQIKGNIKYGEIEIAGKIIEITALNFIEHLSSPKREIRKQTYLTVNQKFQEQEKQFAQILNSIFDARIKNTKLEKYNSVLEKVLFEENINPKIINSLITAVNNNLSLIQKYLKIKSDLLQIEKPHLYDFNVPLGNNIEIKYTIEQAVEIIKNALKPLGKEYLKIVNKLIDGHIDSALDKNKHQSITFSWKSYAFMNFRGSYVDLKNMIHELGHIVNYYLSEKKLPFIYEDSTIFVGETASIINEILLNKYLYKTAKTKEEKIFYLSKEIENYFTSVFKQTMYTEFENDLYNTKQVCTLTPEILSEKYQKLIKKYYGNNIEYDDVSSVEWSRLGHLYRWSYYPYKYATGLIIASTIVNQLLNEHTLSKEEYIKFLSSGSSMYSLDLLKTINVDLTNSNIIDKGFKVLENDIQELTQILNKK